MRVTTDAVQVLGGYGYTRDFPVERYMREAKVMQIFEGTNQIQRMVIARGLRKVDRFTARITRVSTASLERPSVMSMYRRILAVVAGVLAVAGVGGLMLRESAPGRLHWADRARGDGLRATSTVGGIRRVRSR